MASILLCAPSGAETAAPPAGGNPPQSQTLNLPVRLDYPLLEKLLLARVFTGTAGSLDVLNDPTGCSEVVLSEPTLAPKEGRLELLSDVQARLGMGAPGACSTLFNFGGRLGVSGTPELRAEGTQLGFAPDRVWLLDPAGKPISNSALESVARGGAQAALQRFTVDLGAQLETLGELLPEVLPRHSREQINALLDTVRLADVEVNASSLDANVRLTVEAASAELAPEAALSADELQAWEERWQMMDALLVLAVKRYAASTELQALRDALLDALIESRYRLVDALTEGPEAESDTVRDWFLTSWQNLAPTVRQIGLEQPGQEHLLLLGVVTATDALEALDTLGPGIGLDISSAGLRRLARMINGSDGDDLLRYTTEVDPDLRALLEASLPQSPPSAWHFDLSFFTRAHAADTDRLNRWAPEREDLPEYLPSVAVLLQASMEKAADRRKLDARYRELFRRVVLTTAWQESCWRHYVVSDDQKLVPLRSGTGDVGLMQVNERVWRGFYDQQQLRWDITYNSDAGAEVLIDYLMKYALRKGEHQQPGGVTNLARATYSAYNGGPSQVARYRNPAASAYGKKVDEAFWEKYQQVASGNELAVSTCLGGSLAGPALAGSRRIPEADSGPALFTLQLAAFSSEAAARAFIETQGLGGSARVQRRRQGGAGDFLVLVGSYATRAEADAARRRLSQPDAWVRALKDL
jgi:hypothetical protein